MADSGPQGTLSNAFSPHHALVYKKPFLAEEGVQAEEKRDSKQAVQASESSMATQSDMAALLY